MITYQDIREKSFDNAKAVFGGYDMGAVEDYLDDVADAFEALQKENSALKTKMKILVDKIEEYRTNEDALNRSILSAQKLSVQIESDARSRAATIVSEAETKAASILGSIDERIATEEKTVCSRLRYPLRSSSIRHAHFARTSSISSTLSPLPTPLPQRPPIRTAYEYLRRTMHLPPINLLLMPAILRYFRSLRTTEFFRLLGKKACRGCISSLSTLFCVLIDRRQTACRCFRY